MEKFEIWEELETEKTKDEKAIKAAYYAKLKRVNPEDDAEGFKRLREAYDEAIAYAKSNEDEESKEKDEFDLWIDEIREIYENYSRRVNSDEWEKIFDKEICKSLDTQDMAAERLLVFIMEDYFMPYFVWNRIEEIFGIKGKREVLVEKFPGNFIDYVFNEIDKKTDDGFYNYFYGNLNGNPDELIRNQSQCFDGLYEQLLIKNPDERDFSSIHEKIDENKKMNISHIYTTVIEEVVAFYEKDFEKVKDCFNDLVGKLGDDENPYLNNHHLIEGYVLGYEVTGQKEKSEKIREFLAKETDRLYIISDCVRFYMDAGENKKAKELAIECMGKYSEYPTLIFYMQNANKELINQYREEAENGNEDSAYELGWSYFQNEQFEECIEYIKPRKPVEGGKKEYTYNNLLGRCLARNKQYDEAIPYLLRAHELILKVKEKKAEGEEEEKMLEREGLFLATLAMAYHEKSRDVLENNKATRDNYRQADEYLCEAINKIEECVSVEKNMRDMIYYQRERALIYYDNEQYSKCIDVCDEILNGGTDWYYIYQLRSQAFYKLNYQQNVINDFYSIRNLIPDNLDIPYIYISPLMAYLEYGRFEDANELFKFAEEHGADSVILDLFKLYAKFKQEPAFKIFAEIEECISRLINEETNLTKSEIADIIIFMAYVSDDETYFTKTMEKATDFYPGCTRKVNWWIGIYYERRREYQNAVMYFDYTANLAFKQDDIDYNRLRLGKNYWYMNKDDEAFDIYMSVYKNNPKHTSVNRCLAEFYLFKFRNDKKDETINLALKHVNEQAELYMDEGVQRLRAEINLEKYEIAECKKDLLDLYEKEPDSVQVMRMLEKVYRYEGDFENSYNLCLKLMDLEKDDYYQSKYDKFICSSMALHRYDGLEEIILNGYKYNREWAFEKLIRLYYFQGRFDELLEKGRNAIQNGKTDYEKFLGYRTVIDMLSEKGAEITSFNSLWFYLTGLLPDMSFVNGNTGYDKALLKALKEYREFIRFHANVRLYGYECLKDFFFENYGDVKLAIKPVFEMREYVKAEDRYNIHKNNLMTATLFAFYGKRIKAKKHFETYLRQLENHHGGVEGWLKENGYSRVKLYEFGLYYYAMNDLEGLKKCVEGMKNRVICTHCDKCKCFEYYILKGHLEKLRGNKMEALKAYKIALDSAGNASRKYITRLINEC